MTLYHSLTFLPPRVGTSKLHSIKSTDFSQIPSSLSLNSSPPRRTISQDKDGQLENVHLVSLSKQGNLKEARHFLEHMAVAGIPVRPRSYQALFEACGNAKALTEARLVHELFQKTVESPPLFIYNWVLRMFCECGSLVDAHNLFDEMSERNLVSWGVVISGCAREGLVDEAFHIFSKMIVSGIEPNSVVYNSLLGCLVNPSLLGIGKQLHSRVIRSGLGVDVVISTGIVNMYAKCGWLQGAQLVLDHMSEKDAVAWTGLMVGYTQAEKEEDALALFTKMVCEGTHLDEYVFSIALKACANLEDLNLGRQIHGRVVKFGLESDVSVGTPLVDFYVKCKSFECASRAFDEICEPNDVSWSALIAGYCHMGEFKESFKVLKSLRKKNMGVLNSFVYTSIFQACSALADFNSGTQVHADAMKRCLIDGLHGKSAMITMYSRCGRLDYANQVFNSVREPDAVAWTAIIAGHAYQGNATEALELFRRMQDSGIRPNAVTFIAVLTACSHSGLVLEGKRYLDSMSGKFGVLPTIDHYNCMVDIYSRAGYLQEALDLIESMPFAPDAMSWKCLLGGCWTHRNLELGKVAAENLIQLDPDDTAGYVLLFNLYTFFKRWKEASNVRKVMAERNLRKELGCSWINVKSKVHRFIVGDRHHPQTEEIYSKLEELNDLFPKDDVEISTEEDVSCSLLERKEQLLVHSERLAIAFGLMSTPSNAPIVVFKNLRACNDCHDFLKHVSMVTEREIVVRDSFRFHCFKSGECSCKDYW